jgi:biopolymer transport protein ExbD
MKRRESFPLMAEINITPLTDVMLVLLIIFMVSSSFILQEKALNITLPRADGKTPPEGTKALILDLDRNGTVFLNGIRTTEAELDRTLRKLKKEPGFASIMLRADASSSYQKFISLMEILSRADCSNILLAAKPRRSGK